MTDTGFPGERADLLASHAYHRAIDVSQSPALGVLDSWESPGDMCPATVPILVDGVDVELRCELDVPHEEHEATLKWVDDDDNAKAA